jgi:hypothetical protein
MRPCCLLKLRIAGRLLFDRKNGRRSFLRNVDELVPNRILRFTPLGLRASPLLVFEYCLPEFHFRRAFPIKIICASGLIRAIGQVYCKRTIHADKKLWYSLPSHAVA